jgi:hypothetical protein
VEIVVIGLEQLIDLTRGRAITCGTIQVRVAQADLDGLMAALAMADRTKAFRRRGGR